jgi:hypothetical protein
MNIKNILATILISLFAVTISGQDAYQSFYSTGFKVKCGCNLYLNTTFISLAKQHGMNNILAAYVCAENEDNPETGVIYNININNESQGYINFPQSLHSYYEQKYLEKYASTLNSTGTTTRQTIYQGVPAVEYTFDQFGLPTKAIFFIKDKKSYLLQVGTRENLSGKFNSLKFSFTFL